MTILVLSIVALIACWIAYFFGTVDGERRGFKRGQAFQRQKQEDRNLLIGEDENE